MALTPSTMLPLGSAAPDFSLPDPTGAMHRRDDFAEAPALLVVFLCNHCPFVQHIREELSSFVREIRARGVAVVGINSNDVETHPEDSPAKMGEEIERFGYTFPYLYDESQEVAKRYHAACTPDFFLFDAARRLVYRGQFDASRPSNDVEVTGEDLRRACDRLLAGEPLDADQKPSIGCNIKWRAGNEPEYARA